MDWTKNEWVIGIATGVASAFLVTWLRRLAISFKKEEQQRKKERQEREAERILNVPESLRRRK